MKRQIIKTRSDKPYRVARIVIALALLAAAAWFAIHAWLRTLQSRPVQTQLPVRTAVQDSANGPRNPQDPVALA